MSTSTRLKVTHLDDPSHHAESSDLEAVANEPVALPEWAELNLPPAGSDEEEQRFRQLYDTIPALWRRLSGQGHVEQTVVVIPSMTLDLEELQKLKGARHYEERLLFMLILLSLPKTRVIFVTSEPIHPAIIDYYLQLLPGVPFSHARSRLEMFSAHDSSSKSLTAKILERPSLLRRLRRAVQNAPNVHMTVFNVTPLEKSLSVALGIPLLDPDPRHIRYGTKSGCRQLFREAGVVFADGFEDLKNEAEILTAIFDLHERRPGMKRVVIKLNDGFSGDGNSILPLKEMDGHWGDRAEALTRLAALVRKEARFQAAGMNWDGFARKFEQMEGIVEEFIEGEQKDSPSVQLRITPLGECQIISTHDQVLGGPDGQVFIGCCFPAMPQYRPLLHEAGMNIGQRLAAAGVIGRLSIDFLCVPNGSEIDLFAVEINLRKGGTTHPFRTLQFLTGGRYDPDSGLFQSGTGVPKFYFASDNVESPNYKGLLPEDLIDITTYTGLHYNSSSNTGVVFHMIGALSQFGKLGVTCVGDSPEESKKLYDTTIETLDSVVSKSDWISSRGL